MKAHFPILIGTLLLGACTVEVSREASGSVAADALGDAKVAQISSGEEVALEDYLEEGTRTIVEFGAVW